MRLVEGHPHDRRQDTHRGRQRRYIGMATPSAARPARQGAASARADRPVRGPPFLSRPATAGGYLEMSKLAHRQRDSTGRSRASPAPPREPQGHDPGGLLGRDRIGPSITRADIADLLARPDHRHPLPPRRASHQQLTSRATDPTVRLPRCIHRVRTAPMTERSGGGYDETEQRRRRCWMRV